MIFVAITILDDWFPSHDIVAISNTMISLFIVPQRAAEPNRHDQLSDSDDDGRHVHAVVVHWFEVTDHVEDQQSNDQGLRTG